MQKTPPTIATADLSELLARADHVWLVRVPEESDPVIGQIPGSLVTSDEELLEALAADAPMVLYGRNRHAKRASALVARLTAANRDVRWYQGGVEAWAAADHPIDCPEADT
jgi:rhodanese-related sulfurtransferase